MRSKISPGMQKLEQTCRPCADGSSAGKDALASSGGCMARRCPASPGLQSEGIGEPALAKKNICSKRVEPVPTGQLFSGPSRFSGCSAAISELPFSEPAWGYCRHCLALSTGSGLFHSVPQKLNKLTQTGSSPFLSPGREVSVQPESLQQVFTHVLVRQMLEMWLTLTSKMWFTTSCCWDQTSFGGLNLGSRNAYFHVFSFFVRRPARRRQSVPRRTAVQRVVARHDPACRTSLASPGTDLS